MASAGSVARYGLGRLLSAAGQWPGLVARSISFRVALVAASSLVAGSALAGDNTWTNGAFDFNWNTTSANWTSPTTWNNFFYNADSAIFGATGVGPINVIGTINVRSINFGTTTGYSFSGGSLNFSQYGTGTLAAGTINVGGTTSSLTAVNATFTTNLSTPFGLTKTGDGTLTLSGTGNSFPGFVAIGGSSYGTNILIGSATATSFGGRLELGAATALPTSTTVGIGNGIFDIGANNVTLRGVTFAGTRPSSGSYVPNTQGVIGTGTLTINGGPLRAVGNSTGWANFINTAVDTTDSLLRVEVGSGLNANRELMFLQPIGTASNNNFGLLKTLGVSTAGAASAGGFSMLGNNLYTGATTISGGTSNVIGGTNASTALRVAGGTVTLQGASGSFGAATQVLLGPAGVLTLSNTAALTTGNEPPLPAANLDDRINTAAALTLAGGNFALVGSTTAAINQTLASINAASGFSQISLTNGTGQNAVLTVTGNLTHSAGAQLLIRGSAIGNTGTATPTATRVVINGTTPTEVNGLIPGFYGNATSATGNANNFVRYSSTPGVGLVVLQASDYVLNSFSGGPTANVDITTAQTLTTSQSANAVRTSAGITVNAGNTLTIGAGGLLATAGVTIGGAGTVNFAGNPGYIMHGSTGTLTFSSAVTAANGLAVGNAGTITFTGDLSGLSGSYINNSGTTNFNTGTLPGSLPILIRQGTVTSNNAAFGTGSGTITLGDPNTPAGAVTTATLNINNSVFATFSRPIATVGSDGSAPFGATSGLTLTTLSTAAQTISSPISLGTHLTINSAGTANTTFSGPITGAGGLNVLGGVVVISNTSNSYAGGTQLNGGTLAPSADALGSGNVRLLAGTLRTDYAGNFSRGITMLGAATVNTNGNNITMTGGISGENPAATLTKSGAGTLTVTGSGTFAGNLSVTTGEVRLGGASGALFNRGLTVNPGATFTLDNTTANNNNRFSADVTLTGATTSTFRLIGNAGTATDESVGALFVSGGTSSQPHTVDLVSNGQSTILRFAAFSPSTGANLLFSGTNLGPPTGASGAFTRVFFDIAPVPDGGILPGVQFNGFGGTGFAAYSFSRGVILYVPPASSGVVIDNFGTDPSPPTGGPVDPNSIFTTTGNTLVKMGAAVAGLVIDGGSTVTLRSGVYGPSPGNLSTPSDTFAVIGPGSGVGTITSQNGAKTIQLESTLFPGNLSVGPGGVNFNTISDLTIDNFVTIVGAGGITKTGSGVLNINSSTSTFAGPITVNAGTLNLNGSTSSTAAINVNAGTLNLAGAAAVTAGINVSGGTFNLNAGGSIPAGNALNVTGTGVFNINFGGVLSVASASGNGTINIGAGSTLQSNTLTTTVAPNLTGAGNFQYTPTAVSLVTLSGNNTFSGGVSGNANARYIITSPTAFGTGTVDLSAQTTSSSFTVPTVGFDFGPGGVGTVANNFVISGAAIDVFFIARTSINQTVTLSGVISGGNPAGRLVWDESGTSQSNVLRLVNPGNTFTSPVRVDFGTVAITSDGALGNPANGLFLNGGNTTTNGSLRLDAPVTTNRTITVSATSAINTNVFDFAVNGVLAGGGALTKLGIGNLNLNNSANTFTGILNVNGGRVNVNGNLPTSTSGVNVNSGGVLGGTGNITRNVTVNGGGIVSPGISPGVLTINGNITFNAGSAFEVELNGLTAGTGYDQLIVNGNVTLTGALLGGSVGFLPSLGDQFWILVKPTPGAITGTFAGLPEGSFLELGGIQFQITYTANFASLGGPGTGNDVMLTVTAIPEPATLIMISSAVVGAGGIWWNQRQRNSHRIRRRARRHTRS